MATIDIIERLEIRRSRVRLTIFLLIHAFFTTIGLWALCGPQARPDDRPLGILLVLLFGPLTLIFIRLWIRAARPELILTEQGIFCPACLSAPIAWTDVRAAFLANGPFTPSLRLSLYPEVAKRTLGRHYRFSILTALSGKSADDIDIPLRIYAAAPRRVAAFAAERIQAARASRPRDSTLDAVDAAFADPLVASGRRYFTFGLSALLIAIFVGEQIFKASPPIGPLTPSVATLFVLGGVSGASFLDGQWWRVFTAPLLHAGLSHLFVNGVALILASRFERIIGSAWFAGVFAASAVGGALASIAFNAPTTISVGASGGILGLFAMISVASRHFPPGPTREKLSRQAIVILGLAAIEYLRSRQGSHVDFSAHFGGAVVGAALGGLALRLWPRDEARPAGSKFAAAAAAAFFLIAAATILMRL